MFNKKIIAIAILGLATVATSYAAPQSPYVGLQLGYGNVHQNDNLINGGKSTGLAGRVFAGYQFDDTWSAEMGWTRFHNATASDTIAVPGLYSVTGKETIKTNAIDLVVKGSYPVANQVKVYGKLGAAYVMSRANLNVTGNAYGMNVNESYNDKQNKVLPTAGVGVSYEINNNVSADISYNRIQKVGNSKLINSTDFVGAGLTYSFG